MTKENWGNIGNLTLTLDNMSMSVELAKEQEPVACQEKSLLQGARLQRV